MSIGVKNLTEGRIFKQLNVLALPIMAISFTQMAYSLTDMAWVGRLGSESAAAVGSVGILQWLTASAALVSKVGAEVSIGQSVGVQKFKQARIYASHTTTIALIISIVIALCLFFGAETILSFFKFEENIFNDAVGYLKIVCTATPFTFLTFTFFGIYNGSGRTHIPFFITFAGLACNMVLDPLLIFGIGNFEGLNTAGAAWATWISQASVFLIFVIVMKRKNGVLNRFTFFIPLRKVYTKQILKLGVPVAVMNMLFASVNIFLARIASIYGGHIGVMSQTTGGQIEGITWNTSQGFSTALSSFVAQNYAAKKTSRMRLAYRYTLLMLLSLGVLITIAFIFFGKQIFGIFVPETKAMLAGGEYLAIVAFSQIFMMLELTTQGMFNGTGRTMPPAIVSITCNFARIPLALFLASIWGISGIWWSIVFTSVLKGIALPLWYSIVSKRIEKKTAIIPFTPTESQ